MRLSAFIEVLKKELITGLRQRAALASMLMLSLTALAAVSLATGGITLEPELLSALLWIIIFFASSSLDRTFDDEAINMLKVYGESQAVLFGKMVYTLLSMITLLVFVLPIFVILFDCIIVDTLSLMLALILGVVGISGAGTLIAAISSTASARSGLFPILLFPIILPLFLMSIEVTSQAFVGAVDSFSLMIAMSLYDTIVILATSILFESLWY